MKKILCVLLCLIPGQSSGTENLDEPSPSSTSTAVIITGPSKAVVGELILLSAKTELTKIAWSVDCSSVELPEGNLEDVNKLADQLRQLGFVVQRPASGGPMLYAIRGNELFLSSFPGIYKVTLAAAGLDTDGESVLLAMTDAPFIVQVVEREKPTPTPDDPVVPDDPVIPDDPVDPDDPDDPVIPDDPVDPDVKLFKSWLANVDGYDKKTALELAQNYESTAAQAAATQDDWGLVDFVEMTKSKNGDTLGAAGIAKWSNPFLKPLAGWMAKKLPQDKWDDKEAIVDLWMEAATLLKKAAQD